ncbi:hypothetical protein TNCV_3328101 [Trichonephila clavipes]|nr:hypothetical protein TNCV_3328101 [Trichonephila clavipes]
MALLRCSTAEVTPVKGYVRTTLGCSSNTSRPSKPLVMQNHFSLDGTGIIIQLLVLVTPHAVDVEAEEWRGNYAGHFSVDWIKGGQRLTCLGT